MTLAEGIYGAGCSQEIQRACSTRDAPLRVLPGRNPFVPTAVSRRISMHACSISSVKCSTQRFSASSSCGTRALQPTTSQFTYMASQGFLAGSCRSPRLSLYIAL